MSTIHQIHELAGEIARELEPVAGKPFVVFHDAYHYFETRFGLTAVGSITPGPEVQPSAQRLMALRKKIECLGAVCVFSEPQFPSKLTAAVAEGTGSRGRARSRGSNAGTRAQSLRRAPAQSRSGIEGVPLWPLVTAYQFGSAPEIAAAVDMRQTKRAAEPGRT